MNKKMKLISALIVTSCTTSVFAATAGPYLGLQVGQSNTHNLPMNVQTGTIPATVLVKPGNTGIAERFFWGYQFNQYAAFEMGGTHYANSTYNTSISAFSNKEATIRENAFDMVIKGMFPIGTIFDVFAKGGLAGLTASQSGRLNPDPFGRGKNTTSLRLTYGFGASVTLAQNWVIDASLSRINGGSGLQNADLYALGVSYHFVDEYCGQFLC